MTLETIELGRMLDIATGAGQFIHYLLQVNPTITEVVGIDNNERGIAQAQKRMEDKRVTFQVDDAYNLKYADESFDSVTISNSLHHFEDPIKLLTEVKRVLKPGGNIVVSEMFSDGDQTLQQQSHIEMHHWFAKFDRLINRFHDDTYEQQELIDFVAKLDFEDIETSVINMKIDNPKEPKLLAAYSRNIKQVQDMAKARELPEEFITKGTELIAFMEDNGFSPARNILIFAHKQKL
ncbi:MAG: hypothetical protein B6226_03240 [Candidatus Cloacimonetes bacterium 4572_65]|nr:MAG: hypothetical protein B6226_03240 [Candidatus Cloacimonetes bacterium 4572_65]